MFKSIQKIVIVEVFPANRSNLLSLLYSRLDTFKAIFEDSIEFVQAEGETAAKQQELPNV